MTDPRNPMPPPGLTHDEVVDLAASFVLDALEPDEMAAVREHLATCTRSHDEMVELGGVVPALAASVPLVDPPASLKARLMAAAAADLEARQIAADSTAIEAPAPPPKPAESVVRPFDEGRAGIGAWALGLAAVIAVVALGAWNLSLQRQLDDAQAYQQQVAAVLDAAQQPGSLTAVMRAAEATGPSGFAAITSDGVARIAMRDLAPTTGSEVYEAWVIAPGSDPVPLGEASAGGGGDGAALPPRASPGPRPRPGPRSPSAPISREPGAWAPTAAASDARVRLGGGRARTRMSSSPQHATTTPATELRQPLEVRGGSAAGSTCYRRLGTGPARHPVPGTVSASVAAAISASASAASAGKRATPTDTETARPATTGRSAMPSWTRRATIAPADPGATRTNSSPPMRPTVSTSRTDSASTAATRRRMSSPTSRPSRSLADRKSSISKRASDTSPPCRPARASSSSRTRPPCARSRCP